MQGLKRVPRVSPFNHWVLLTFPQLEQKTPPYALRQKPCTRINKPIITHRAPGNCPRDSIPQPGRWILDQHSALPFSRRALVCLTI